MNKSRLYYRVALKLLTFSAVIILLTVFVNSLLVSSSSDNVHKKNVPFVMMDVNLMKNGEIRKTRWNGKEVAVLYRNDLSFKEQYFVYLNYGDSGNCPLFYRDDTFKDVCTGTLFDSYGIEKNKQNHGYKLKSPPYSMSNIKSGKILIGNSTK